MTREYLPAHRSGVRVGKADWSDTHELIDQDLLTDNRLGTRHLAGDPDVDRPARDLLDHHLAGEGPEVDAYPGMTG